MDRKHERSRWDALRVMNKHEFAAWLRFALIGVIFGGMVWRLFFAETGDAGADVWNATHDAVSVLLYAMVFAMLLLTRPGKGVVEDERDRAISAMAAKAGLVALSLIVAVSATILDIGAYAGVLNSRPANWFRFYLFACVALAWWVESAVCIFQQWRDRR